MAKEMQFSDLLDKTFDLYKKKAWKIIQVMLLYGMLPVFVLLVGYVGLIIAGALETVAIIVLGIVVFAVLVYFVLINQAAQLIVIRDRKKEYSLGELYELAKPYVGPLLGFAILSTLVLIGGFLLLIIPGIILSIYLSFGNFIIVNENKGVGEAFSRSFEIIKDRWWKTLLYLVVIFIISYGVGFVGGIAASLAAVIDEILGQIVSFIFQIAISFIIGPFNLIYLQIIYEEYVKTLGKKTKVK